MTRVWFLSAALADVESARQWYEAQRPGLGDEFVDAIDAAVGAVVEFPDTCPFVHRDARRYLVERFPYGIYYRVEGSGVVVVACLHAVRDPEHRRRRLGG